MRSMIEGFGELPDDVDQLKALALGAMSQTLSLTAKVEDLTQTNAAAKAEIDRLTEAGTVA